MDTERHDSGLLRQSRPPYVAYTSFDRFCQSAAREELPGRVDSALLARWNVAAGNESALLTSLKGLGLIDANGRPTGDFREMRLSAPRRLAALQRCAERAYPGLGFDAGVPRGSDQLRDYFVDQRGLRGQMIDKAVRFYRGLEQALGAGAPAERATGQRRESRAGSGIPAATPGTGGPPRGTLPLALSVQVPFGADEEELTAFFRRLRRAWTRAMEVS